ncbi:GNAT family N-acetyltransferase [Rhodococcus opacus]|uniref:GNAT family N-acetyltransferase n=1 Tax=Rhodococcus opacus TaxID=37919 RepID=UPI0018C8B363
MTTANRLRIIQVGPDSEVLDAVRQWFAEPDMQHWMGASFQFESLVSEMGTTGRIGSRVRLDTVAWVGLDVDNRPVAFIGGQISVESAQPDDAIEMRYANPRTLGFVYIVSPQHRRRGYGRAIVQTVLEHPATADIEVFSGTVNADNRPSLSTLKAIEGFKGVETEGEVSFTFTRRAPDEAPEIPYHAAALPPASRMSPDAWTQADLAAVGFVGFVPFAALLEADVPREPGVYVMIRPSESAPEFLSTSPAGWLKGRDPSVPIDVLQAAWVSESSVVYIGKASAGSAGRRGLRQRLGEFRRFGVGEPVPHRGGRRIWQLADHADLLVGWKVTTDGEARPTERAMIAQFEAAHGKRPFANVTR